MRASAPIGQVVCFGEMLLRLSPPAARMVVQAHNLDMIVGGAELLGKTFSGDGAERRCEAVDAAFTAFPDLQLVASTARVDARTTKHQTAEIDVTGIVDRIGTGDAFSAGVLHGYLAGGDVRR